MNDRITLRFLAAPMDAAAGGGTVAAGRVLEWIDKAGYACAVGWSSSYCVTGYVGNVHFTQPIQVGDLVQAHARIIYTGRTSMHVLVSVESSDVRTREYSPATHCILVFVAVGADGRSQEVPPWAPQNDADRNLRDNAEARIDGRRRIRDQMLEAYSVTGTTPRTVFRFLAAPGDANWGGNAHGGTVMRWIDETAFACAASWSSTRAVAVYAGGIHFFRPIHIGHIVELDARLLHTGHRSMHIAVRVRSGSPQAPRAMELTTQCMSIFVEVADGRAAPVVPLQVETEEDRRLDALALELISLRDELGPFPVPLRAH